MAFHGTPRYSMEFHGIPWNSITTSWNSVELHGYSMELHEYSTDTPWEFRGIPWISVDFHGFPWISMEFHGGISHGGGSATSEKIQIESYQNVELGIE